VGNNAKSKVEELLQATFGSYCVMLPTAFITGKRTQSSGATPEIIRCKYAKLVLLQEPNKGDVLNSGVIKELTGGDRMYARGLYEEGTEFFPMFKVILVCNDEPAVSAEDIAFWKRTRVLPHESVFDDLYPDTEVEQFRQKRFPIDRNFSRRIDGMKQAFMYKLIKRYVRKSEGETNGVFTMKIEPAKVLSATNKYRRDNDKYKSFVDSRLAKDPNKNVSIAVSEVYRIYKDWIKESYPNAKVPNKMEFAQQISKRVLIHPSMSGLWYGLRLKDAEDADSNDVRRFLSEKTVENGDSFMKALDLFEEYNRWIVVKNSERSACEEDLQKNPGGNPQRILGEEKIDLQTFVSNGGLEVSNGIVFGIEMKDSDTLESQRDDIGYESDSSDEDNEVETEVNIGDPTFTMDAPFSLLGGNERLTSNQADEPGMENDSDSETEDNSVDSSDSESEEDGEE
jgi:hypothetical protein